MVSSVVKDVLGAVGGGILSFCLLPQLWKVWRTRSATDLSMPFLVLYNTGALMVHHPGPLHTQLRFVPAGDTVLRSAYRRTHRADVLGCRALYC